jgi:TrmH family RNA methyltransferase
MRYTVITSQSNPVVKEALKIKSKMAKLRNEAFFIEGIHLIETALESGNASFKTIFFTNGFMTEKEGGEFLKKFSGNNLRLVEVSDSVMAALCDTETPQGIAAIVSIKTIGFQDIKLNEPALMVICDGIQDPGNLGTIIRISDAAGADAVVAMPGTCDAFAPKSLRASAGSIFHLPVIYLSHDDLSVYLEAKGISLLAADAHGGVPIYECDLSNPVAIAFGNEARGLSSFLKEIASGYINIPFEGKAESINAAMAASICLYEALRQRKYILLGK